MDERKIGNALVLRNGTEVRNLKELYDALSTMGEEAFSHHVDGQRNDFASWAEQYDKFLARQLRQAKTREHMQKALFMAMFK